MSYARWRRYFSDSFRKMDLVARYGGEEFVIFFEPARRGVRIAEG